MLGLLLALGLCAEPARDSLEELLRRARAEEQARFEALSGPVQKAIAELEALGRRDPPEKAAAIRQRLAALGQAAAPLLLSYLDPGDGEGTQKRASEVAQVLASFASPALTARLIELAQSGSLGQRLNAVQVLASAPQKDLVAAALAPLLDNPSGELRAAAAGVLAELGTERALTTLAEALDTGDAELVRTALIGLTSARSAAAAPAVRSLLEGPQRVAGIVDALLAYYRAVPQAIDESVVQAFVDLAAISSGDGLAEVARLALLDAVPRSSPARTPRLRKSFEPLLVDQDEDLRTGAQIALALLGDRKQRADVMRAYDEQVQRSDRWAPAYEARAGVLARLREFDLAARDYKHAIDLHIERGDGVAEELRVELARAYCLDGKLKLSFEALELANLSVGRRKELAGDPDFAALVAHAKYGKILD
jgi:HEAT repeat protein